MKGNPNNGRIALLPIESHDITACMQWGSYIVHYQSSGGMLKNTTLLQNLGPMLTILGEC